MPLVLKWVKSIALFCLLAIAGCGSDNSATRSLDVMSLSGTVTAAAGSAVDADVNDSASPPVPNNTPAAAQPLSGPVSLGGYVTPVATGVAGDQFETIADDQDWYRVTLAAGENIVLTIADHDGNSANTANPDLDLFLVDPVTLLDVQTSEGSGRQEIIPVLTGGEYLVQVFAFTAGSNYTLRIGSGPTMALAPALRIEDEFIPGQVIVRFRETADPASPSPSALSSAEGQLGLEPLAGAPGGPRLYRMGSSPSSLSARQPAATARVKGGDDSLWRGKRETLDLVKSLRRSADVLRADLNYVRRPLLTPDDPFFPSQWHSSMINLPQAWDLTTGDAAVVTAVLDTGVLPNHPDLVGRLCTATDPCVGYAFVSDPTSGADGDGIDPDPTDPGDHMNLDGSSSFHGTQVSGILAAAGNNQLGVTGVDWTGKLMPVRVLGAGVGSSYDVIQGVRYAAGLSNDSGTLPAQPADILNLSLGGGGFSQAEQDLYTQLHGLGIMVVSAAGNDASTLPSYPAAYDNVISVSAVDIDQNLAPYSNTGPTIDLAAPGGYLGTDRNGDALADGVLGTNANDLLSPLSYTYTPIMGTSMATPQVAGVIALMKAVYPALAPADVDLLLTAGALTQDLLGDGAAVRNDSFGYGLIDAQKAVLAALDLAGGGVLPPSLAIQPNALDFGNLLSSLTLTLDNAGGGSLNVTAVSSTAPWFVAATLTAESTPGSGLGDYQVTIDRTGLADGNYTGELIVTTDAPGSYTVPMLLQVGASSVADLGTLRVYLLDAATGNRLQTVTPLYNTANGTYSYSFPAVAPGTYQVTAGSDMDNDGQLCDPGEACGNYGLLNAPTSITVGGSPVNGIDFSAGF